jgi:c-di-GMP-binding flagellar brake protein YcgR
MEVPMQNPLSSNSNRRSCQRFTILLRAQYHFDNNLSFRDCTIIDISRSGAAIMLPKDENTAKGNIIFIDILKGLESISLRGAVVWVSIVEGGYLAGVKFTRLIDADIFKRIG